MTRESNEFQKMILKQVATKKNDTTRGTNKRRKFPANVIDLAQERARRRAKPRK